MATLALPLAIAAAVALPPTRTFWRPEPSVGLQTNQVRVEATLVLEGQRVAFYQQFGHEPTVTPALLGAVAHHFDEVVIPRLDALVGPATDVDENGRIIVLICPSSTHEARVMPSDLLSETEANRYGLHSNQGEVIYHPFSYLGNRMGLNGVTLSAAYLRMVVEAHHPGPPGWSRWLGNYAPFLLGEVSPRWLWGDADPQGRSYAPHDPWTEHGWSMLLIEYLHQRQGDQGLRELTERSSLPTATFQTGQRSCLGADLLADFGMACWLDDPILASGRFGFGSVHPPRPLAAARAVASRPSSGLLQVGAGGMAYLAVEGTGDRSFPLILQGDPEAVWSARAVLTREQGPDEELTLGFGEQALARLELPRLAAGEAVVVAIVAQPGDVPGGDRRILTLQWGVGWVPHLADDEGQTFLAEAVGKALPDGGKAVRERLATTLSRLIGEAVTTPAITTRFAYSPAAHAVVEVLRQEIDRRGLKAQIVPFTHRSPAGVDQEWENVLVELPGSDSRRWPVVLAAHWDAVRGDAEESTFRALSASDNAASVATVLEVATALSRRQRQNPVLVAFLAGGHEDTAGAAALLAERQGRIAAWIELDALGIPERSTRAVHIRLEAPKQMGRLPVNVIRACKEVGVVARVHSELESAHTGAPLAFKRGIPALVLRGRTSEEAARDAALPLEVERHRISLDLLTLVAKAVSDATTTAAGGR
ncbi:MAG TPA: M28 family peptidase [Thermoanaerobaculaceae bacterium]|mgnify:CR=1 FL=1|nr:M28 family peptidase [Thermoanaerobaculaceae bacterium]HPS79337.1 M28 family peptidase [Thermoanaerobaculaceae bacterium]